MSSYLLDTNILLGYLWGADYATYVEQKYSVSAASNLILISVVSVGELYSLALQNGWGKRKLNQLHDLLKEMPMVDINEPTILDRYSEIDAYSYNRHPKKKMPREISACPMGKNDVWIAATASVLNMALITTDKDFDHLNGVFLDVIYVDQHSAKAKDEN